MKWHPIFFAVVTLLGPQITCSVGQEAAPSLVDEMRTMRSLLEQQTKRLDTMAEQLSQVRQRLGDGAAAPTPPTPAPTTVETTAPGEPPPHAENPHGEVPVAKAEATGGGIKHLVVKGETLTSIAKHYNVPLAELQKANKNLNERKMQIGQVLTIPAAAAEAPAEKKETP